MKKLFKISILVLITILFSGNKSNIQGDEMTKKEPKVMGIGGIFFKSENPEETKKWYEE